MEACDFVVVGSGIAGLIFALKVAPAGRVVVLTKKENSEAATNYAQGGVAAVVSPEDSFDLHMKDTITCGAGLSRPDVVDVVVRSGPRLVRELADLGVGFSRGEGAAGDFSLGREGGHSRRRIVHAADLTGREVEAALLAAVGTHANISLREHHLGLELVTEGPPSRKTDVSGRERPRCWGVHALDVRAGEIRSFVAPTTLLATGGCGKVYLYTSNPDICTGDGLAMAYRARARLANLEFVQFHPTCLYDPEGVRNFLISEAVRGEGAELVDGEDRPFMKKYDPRGSLASRDIVARAVDAEMKRSGDKHVFLDMRPLGTRMLEKRFPHIYQRCREAGYDPARTTVPVVPAAHYMCGGVRTDLSGRTDVEGLLACGEVACTGLHGANRLASNSLLEALVLADRAAASAREDIHPKRVPAGVTPWTRERGAEPSETVMFDHDWDDVRRLMWDYVGIVRSDQRLRLAQSRVVMLRRQIEGYYDRFRIDPDLVELRNIALVSDLIVRAALSRPESRGLHYNRDHPAPDPRFDGTDTLLDPLTDETMRGEETG